MRPLPGVPLVERMSRQVLRRGLGKRRHVQSGGAEYGFRRHRRRARVIGHGREIPQPSIAVQNHGRHPGDERRRIQGGDKAERARIQRLRTLPVDGDDRRLGGIPFVPIPGLPAGNADRRIRSQRCSSQTWLSAGLRGVAEARGGGSRLVRQHIRRTIERGVEDGRAALANRDLREQAKPRSAAGRAAPTCAACLRRCRPPPPFRATASRRRRARPPAGRRRAARRPRPARWPGRFAGSGSRQRRITFSTAGSMSAATLVMLVRWTESCRSISCCTLLAS